MRLTVFRYESKGRYYYSIDFIDSESVLEGKTNVVHDSLLKLSDEQIIKGILVGKNLATKKFENFANLSSADKLKTLFKMVAKFGELDENKKLVKRNGEESSSGYTIMLNGNTRDMLRFSTHKKTSKYQIKRNIRQHKLREFIQFIFFDKNDPNNGKTRYADGMKTPSTPVNVDGIEHSVREFYIDSEHLCNWDEFMKVVDALIEYFKTGTFIHPFVGDSSKAVEESRKPSKEYHSPYSDHNNPLFRNRTINPNWNPYRCHIIGC